MNEFDLSENVTVNTFGFNVPCRQFVISAQVTRDRRMPMVDEFVMRALKLCQRLPVARLAGYFGFSKTEMQSVLVDLTARTLIVVEGNDVYLHPSAMEMFRTSAEGVATIMEVEEWVEWLWFDLISQNMIASQGLRRGRNLLELKSSGRALPEQFAREAFHTNFRDYLRIVRRITNTTNLSLYAITDVQAGRFGFVPIAGKEELIFDPQPRLRPSILEGYEERPQRLRLLTDAMTQALRELAAPEPSAAARSEYERLADTKSVTEATKNDGFLNLRKWLEDERKYNGPYSCALVGASYVEHNRKAFCAMLDRTTAFANLDDSAPVELLWFRPGGSAWGATDDVRLMGAELRAVIRKHSRLSRDVTTSLIVPAALRNDKPRRFDRIFACGLFAPSGFLSPGIEILLVRGLGAMVLVSVRLSEKVSVWIGRATTRPEDLDRIEHRLRWVNSGPNLEQIWSAKSYSEAEQI